MDSTTQDMTSPAMNDGVGNLKTHRVSTSSTGSMTATDPFANQRPADNDPFAEEQQEQRQQQRRDSISDSSPTQGVPTAKRDRRMSKEWDASKVPPSRFQKPEGSIYATPSSRDGHVDKNVQTGFMEKLKEKGWL